MALKLARPQWSQAIVDSLGQATRAFSRCIDAAMTAIENIDLTLTAHQQRQTAILTTLKSAQIGLQVAQFVANNAQTAADGGGSLTARSAAAVSAAVTVSSTVSWTAGPLVSLAGVSAGNLTVIGSGPHQDADVSITVTDITQITHIGQYRIVEVIGGIDGTVYGPFAYSAIALEEVAATGSYLAAISNDGAASVSTIDDPRASVGAVQYRLDFIRVSGPVITSLLGYLFARRA